VAAELTGSHDRNLATSKRGTGRPALARLL